MVNFPTLLGEVIRASWNHGLLTQVDWETHRARPKNGDNVWKSWKLFHKNDHRKNMLRVSWDAGPSHNKPHVYTLYSGCLLAISPFKGLLGVWNSYGTIPRASAFFLWNDTDEDRNKKFHGDTVDGSEIRRSPVEAGTLSLYLQGFIHPRWCGFFPSTIWW